MLSFGKELNSKIMLSFTQSIIASSVYQIKINSHTIVCFLFNIVCGKTENVFSQPLYNSFMREDRKTGELILHMTIYRQNGIMQSLKNCYQLQDQGNIHVCFPHLKGVMQHLGNIVFLQKNSVNCLFVREYQRFQGCFIMRCIWLQFYLFDYLQ